MNTVRRILSFLALSFFACNALGGTIPVWERLAPTRRHARGRRLLAPDDQCAAELWTLEHRLIQVVHPVDLQGHWVSSECEIHPGPKYVLRDYQFYKTGNFLIRHYEYKDDACTSPVYGFTANGNVLHLSKSWAVPGGTDSTFALNQVTVVPYTKSAAKTLTRALRRNCRLESDKSFDWPWLEEYRDYLLYNNPNDDENLEAASTSSSTIADDSELLSGNSLAEMDCLHSANFTMIHMGLLRMDEILDDNVRSSSNRQGDKFFTRQLYFGKAVWDEKNATHLRPSSFQDALVDVDQMTNCRTCQRIKSGNPLSPPRLKMDQHPEQTETDSASDPHLWAASHQLPTLSPAVDHLDGDWISTRCESYEHGMYAHRRMSFSTAAQTWQLRQRYYNDPLCKHASFTLLADGRYSVSEPDLEILSGAQRLSYRIERVKLVPESRATVHNLRRADNCGPGHKWRQGRALDISPFGGCAPLGILVPAVTKDILKVIVDDGSPKAKATAVENRRWLFTGDYAAVEYSGRDYPTSFQSPLVKCAEMTVVVSLDTSKSAPSPDERYGINFSKWQTNACSKISTTARLIVVSILVQSASYVISCRSFLTQLFS